MYGWSSPSIRLHRRSYVPSVICTDGRSAMKAIAFTLLSSTFVHSIGRTIEYSIALAYHNLVDWTVYRTVALYEKISLARPWRQSKYCLYCYYLCCLTGQLYDQETGRSGDLKLSRHLPTPLLDGRPFLRKLSRYRPTLCSDVRPSVRTVLETQSVPTNSLFRRPTLQSETQSASTNHDDKGFRCFRNQLEADDGVSIVS
jgi:hypothetical protein